MRENDEYLYKKSQKGYYLGCLGIKCPLSAKYKFTLLL
jgi:hypothetical protein